MLLFNYTLWVIVFLILFPFAWTSASSSVDFNFREEAIFAVDELKKLSDSGIYSTLSLSKIVDASTDDGIFHTNTMLRLELASPYFRSKKPHETFNMIVMKHKEDGIKSFAIDEFPVMDEDAIEQFWIQKVEAKRRLREEAFRRLEIEALLLGEEASYTDESKIALRKKIDSTSVSDLLSDFDTPSLQKLRQDECASMLKQLSHKEYVDAESRLSQLSLEKLYEITIDALKADDYEKYRAKQLLDSSMAYLQQRFSDTRSAGGGTKA